MIYRYLEETDSTNSYVARNAAGLADMTMVYAGSQTAGRGQRGNSWESEPGCNLTLSLFHRPVSFPANRQFAISETVALAVVDMLAEHSVRAKVKWPNDIYVGDRKIAGILIEHALMGKGIMHTCSGIGLNVNQTVFRSDAPNPVSMAQLADGAFSLDEVRESLGRALERRLAAIGTEEERMKLHREYLGALWRADGRDYPFRDTRTGEEFMASVRDVEPAGYLILRDSDGRCRRYSFKEVAFII